MDWPTSCGLSEVTCRERAGRDISGRLAGGSKPMASRTSRGLLALSPSLYQRVIAFAFFMPVWTRPVRRILASFPQKVLRPNTTSGGSGDR